MLPLLELVKNRFFTLQKKNAKILVLGCGEGELCYQLSLLDANSTVVGVDLVPQSTYKNNNLFFVTGDILEKDLFSKMSFDLIVDDHCLHLFADNAKRIQLFFNLQNWLSESGLVLGETIVRDGKSVVEDPFYLENDILWRRVKGEMVVWRKVLSCLELENEFLNHHFQIRYFYFRSDVRIFFPAGKLSTSFLSLHFELQAKSDV